MIESVFNQGKTLASIAEAQAKSGDIKGAFSTVGMIESVEDQARTLASIAEAQATAGDIKKALATITLALNYAKKIEDVDDRSGALSSIAVFLSDMESE